MTGTGLLQVVPTRLSCYELVVNNLSRADDIRLVGTTSYQSVGLINLVTRYNLSTGCVRTACSELVDNLLEQPCDKSDNAIKLVVTSC